ncbi:hypothetical protein OsI_01618 [Oryza sativa Indica Group]|uniref:Serine aminopeptidase S33 domain-containing protein n=1 Tax=Oryza sativa subsp. indica TaxID=39946 RepID=B8A724_ORYSI|nr:hypothetical protein OsI_01618 [Oryza sativa Indica Group]
MRRAAAQRGGGGGGSADEKSPFGRLTAEEFYARHGVVNSSSTFVNPRGLRIFTQRWVPAGGDAPLLGAIAVVHGFTGESSWTVQLTAVHFAKAGFAVAAVDHQGHGFSEGLQGHIPDIVPVLEDCEAAFAPFRADYPPPLPCFLYGESLGGAIALLLHLRDKERWRDGAVLNGAMCGVELPLLVVHGGEDTVCDPGCAEELHRRAGSKDKTLRVYPGMWHQLVGEPEENVDKVFGDVLDWLKSHAAAAAAARGEGQQ